MHVLLKLISSPWFWSDIVLSVAGGIIVCWGLRIEKKAEKLLPPEDFEPDLYADVIIRQKREIDHGWRILMTGIVFEVIAALGISIISGIEMANLDDEASLAKEQSANANERASMVQSNNLVLEKEVLKLRNPSVITDDERETFVKILSDIHNQAKIPIEVIVGSNDRNTERFAFQIRKILDEAGYGRIQPKNRVPLDQLGTNSLYVTDEITNIDLPRFDLKDAFLVKMPHFVVNPLPVPEATNYMTPPGALMHSEIPFTDKEPNIIALFSGEIPPPKTLPSVMVVYPTDTNPDRGFSHVYVGVNNPNAVLYGVCEVFNEIGITVGRNTNTVMSPGRVAFFIPGR